MGKLPSSFPSPPPPDRASLVASQLTTARANQTTDFTNGRAANWAPEVVFSPFRALFRVPLLLLNQPVLTQQDGRGKKTVNLV